MKILSFLIFYIASINHLPAQTINTSYKPVLNKKWSGLTISVNTLSQLSCNARTGQIRLQGESLFTIPKSMTIVIGKNTRLFISDSSKIGISAYSSDSFIRLTLYRGAAKVYSRFGAFTLKAGQRIILDSGLSHTSEARLRRGDTAWINGDFWCNYDKLPQVLKRLGRYYPTNFKIANSVRKVSCDCEVSLKKTLDDMLLLFSEWYHFTYIKSPSMKSVLIR